MGEAQGKLDGKVAIITGAGRGVGQGIAFAFAKAGARVVLTGRTAETLDAVAAEIRRLGREALPVVCDVGVEAQVKSMVDRAAKAFGPIDILVNNAQGMGAVGSRIVTAENIPLEEFPEDVWDGIFQTGVKATFYCCKAVFPYMKGRGGKIINFASWFGLMGHAGTAAYNANKEAIRALTRTAAREWGQYKINVNVVCPAVATAERMRERAAEYEARARSIPLRRFGDAEMDIGRVVVFLASDDSGYVTGQTMLVDGGTGMWA